MNRTKYASVCTVLCFLAHAFPGYSSEPWKQEQGYRFQRLDPPHADGNGFQPLVDREIGITWTNSLPADQYSMHQNLMNGSGVALGDFDGDGWCDIYFCNKFGRNALYKNLGNWKFEDVTARAGVGCTNQISTGAVFADFDGDGRLDLFVSSFRGPNALFRNLGNGTFANVGETAGLLSKGGCTSMALADLSGSGNLDLYVCYFGIEAILRDGAVFSTRNVGGKPVVTGKYARRLKILNGKVVEYGEPDQLYRNDSGRFQSLKWEDFFQDSTAKPLEDASDYGLAVQIRDVNGDGYPDIYVCNDFHTPDRFWLNDGKGHFKAVSPEAVRTMSYASMGVDFADLDRDGNLDYFTVEMLSRERQRHLRQFSPRESKLRVIGDLASVEDVARNTLLWNRGDGTYAEIAWYAGVAASDWSWTPIFLDVDLDGYEDLLISNGHLHDVNDRDMNVGAGSNTSINQQENRRRLLQYPSLETPNAAYRNRANLRFEDKSAAWGFNSTLMTQGMALADLDNDGDLDVVANCLNAAPLVYKNLSSRPRIAVRLHGKAPNTQGIGSKISISKGTFTQTQEVLAGGRYLSGDDAIRVFAVPQTAGDLTLKIQWRSGSASVIPLVETNCLYEIDESGSSPVKAATAANTHTKSLFADVSTALNHVHFETEFDDFQRQPTLPRKLSQLGPGVCWMDLDHDGLDDLIIGSGRGGRIATFHNSGNGGFEQINKQLPVLGDDSGPMVAWAHGDKRAALVAITDYETRGRSSNPLRVHSAESETAAEGVAPLGGSIGALAMGDIDGDGSLELYIGSRLLPGRYPEAAPGKIYRFDGNRFSEDKENSAVVSKAGIVSSALFSDLDGDGFPELILACEWGPIRVFQNNRGVLSDATARLGFDKWTGLWSSVTTGDLNGDGQLEIVAGNWGLNSFYNRGGEGPWYLYYANLNSSGQNTLIEAYQEPATREIVPFRSRDSFTDDWPELKSRITNHADFARANLDRILGPKKGEFARLEASTLASMVFYKRDGKWIPELLPRQAQWAPVFGLNIADFDGDGIEDLFIAQNNSAVRPDDDRLDAGRGLLLQGQGDGKLREVPGHESGLKIYGDQRGSAVADYDGDGKADLVVTQNGAATKLYHNQAGQPCLRVRLKGPAGNPLGFGAVMRVVKGEWKSPSRELHCGSGYGSQDSAVELIHIPEGRSELWIRWPGGKETRSEVDSAAKEIEIDTDGKARVLR